MNKGLPTAERLGMNQKVFSSIMTSFPNGYLDSQIPVILVQVINSLKWKIIFNSIASLFEKRTESIPRVRICSFILLSCHML